MCLLRHVPGQVLSASLHVVLVLQGVEEMKPLPRPNGSDARLTLLFHKWFHILLDVSVGILHLARILLLQGRIRLGSPYSSRTRRHGLGLLRHGLSLGGLSIFPRKAGSDVLAVVHALPICRAIDDGLDVGGVVAPWLGVVVLAVDPQVLPISTLTIGAEIQRAAVLRLRGVQTVKEDRAMRITIPVELRFGRCHDRLGD
mmetsp:Transcript_90063/g.143362  ORF Transcript_90063/g.143362 Transcript_90063/m.143362 type:complete len:200 (+) Transcript_90063:138-737(+)